jgi:hypothetical protein
MLGQMSAWKEVAGAQREEMGWGRGAVLPASLWGRKSWN